MPGATKKVLILAILEILRGKTDAEHPMLQADIMKALERQYGMTATRKTVRQNLTVLLEAGYPIEYDKGWYYEHPFCYAELKLITDSIRFNTAIRKKQADELINRVRALGSAFIKPDMLPSPDKPKNPEFMYTYDVLHEAIDKGRQVSFVYNDYDVDKKLHPRLDADGEPKSYTVSPYHIIVSNGHTYLVCNIAKYDTLTHFRADRMTGIRLCESPIRMMRDLPEYSHGFDLQTYTNRHLHMFSGEPSAHRLACSRGLCGDVLDWFGMDVKFDHITDQSFQVCVYSDETSLQYWLSMYGEFAKEV